MTLTQKESGLLKDLISQEKVCIEKYAKYACSACDGQLKNLFNQLGQTEQQHLQTLEHISSGTVPQINTASGQQQPLTFQPSLCTPQEKQSDTYLCSDALSTEKHVSSAYNTSIFEFTDVCIRDALNHIQKEEQEHGQKIFSYMSANGMYNAQ